MIFGEGFHRILLWLAVAVLARTSLPSAASTSAQIPLTADQIIAKAAARTQDPVRDQTVSLIATKVTVVDELDSAGKVTERKEKMYQLEFRSGQTTLKLLSVNGHPPSKADLKTAADNDSGMRRLLGDQEKPNSVRESFLTPELISHYHFSNLGDTMLAGRKTYMIGFRPRTGQPEHRLVDRLLNRLSGTLWIDSEEFEVAQADARLGSEVDFLAGILGVLRKMDFTMTRTRLAEGVWLNTAASGDFEGRKLFASRHLKIKTETTGFRPLAYLQPFSSAAYPGPWRD